MADDDIIEINKEDLPEESAPPLPVARPIEGPVLEISLEDLDVEPAPNAPLPPVTAEHLAAARPSLTIRTWCSATGRPFLVRWTEERPGIFVTHEVIVPDPMQPESNLATNGPSDKISGRFQASANYACPFCGSHMILVCGHCGADLCAGPKNKGPWTCPACKACIAGVTGAATSATGVLGFGKGKKPPT